MCENEKAIMTFLGELKKVSFGFSFACACKF